MTLIPWLGNDDNKENRANNSDWSNCLSANIAEKGLLPNWSTINFLNCLEFGLKYANRNQERNSCNTKRGAHILL